jgi:hypothetical protein
MTAKLPAEGSIPNRATGLQTLYQEQERRKRVLGWRRTHKDQYISLKTKRGKKKTGKLRIWHTTRKQKNKELSDVQIT